MEKNICSDDFFNALNLVSDLVFELNIAFFLIGLMIGFVLPYLVHGFIVAPLLYRLRGLDKKEDDLIKS